MTMQIDLWLLLTACASCFAVGFSIGFKTRPQITENKVNCDIANKSGFWHGWAPQVMLTKNNGKCVSVSCTHCSKNICDFTKEKCKFIH